VRCLDLNANREKLVVVDENSRLALYDLPTKVRGHNAAAVFVTTPDRLTSTC